VIADEFSGGLFHCGRSLRTASTSNACSIHYLHLAPAPRPPYSYSQPLQWTHISAACVERIQSTPWITATATVMLSLLPKTLHDRHPDLFAHDANIDRHACHRKVPMQVLALGFSRTGTFSMRTALEILGSPDLPLLSHILQHPRHRYVDGSLRVQVLQRQNQTRPRFLGQAVRACERRHGYTIDRLRGGTHRRLSRGEGDTVAARRGSVVSELQRDGHQLLRPPHVQVPGVAGTRMVWSLIPAHQPLYPGESVRSYKPGGVAAELSEGIPPVLRDD